MYNHQNIKPMLLKEITQPFTSSKYFFEIKFDGLRAIIYVDKNTFTIRSRNNHDITSNYPELKEIQTIVGNNKIIFDGEIIALNSRGLPSFSALQSHKPVCFVAFDILYKNKSFLNTPLYKRKEILAQYPNTTYFFKSPIYNNGIKLFQAIKKQKMEGIVAKAKTSLYYPSIRSNDWLKIKNFQKGTFIVHGYIINKSKYSLLLGNLKDKQLYYVGKVSIMFTNPLVKKLLSTPSSSNKFVNFNKQANYLKPTIKVKVSYLEKTSSGCLRHPIITSYK